MVNISSIRIEPSWNIRLCMHVFYGEVIQVKDKNGEIRHAKVCAKCGKQFYID